MGANPTQAIGITLFLIAFVLLAGAMAGGGILYLLGFLVLLGISIAHVPEVQAVGAPERVAPRRRGRISTEEIKRNGYCWNHHYAAGLSDQRL